MSATQTRLPHAQALELAWDLVALLGPSCERIEVCGSLRRGRLTIGDIEIVAVPILERIEQHDLFGPVGSIEIDRLHERCIELVHDGQFFTRPDKNGVIAFGTRAKRLLYRDFGLDLFAVKPPAQWGVIQVIRTGSNEFSKRLVTPVGQGGWMPEGMRCRSGALWRWGELVETPEEIDVFRSIGRDFVPPEQREV